MHNRITVFAIFALPALATASGWQHYGGDAGGQRYAAESEVTPANVAGLVPAWQFRTGDATDADPEHGRRSSFRATPVLFADNLLFSTGFNRVFSIGAETGELRWVYDPKVDFSVSYSEMFTSRGVSVWIDRSADSETVCANRVLLGTLDARLIALDANTGKVCEQFGRNGAIDLSTGVRNFRRGEYSLTSPVTVVNDVIVVGSSVGDNGGVKIDSGIVRGYAAATGRLLWSWDPVPGRVSAPGGKSWGRRGGKGNGGTNVWSVISADP
ncbi:MAG: PQQ-binding-like beta-propeller repeat protein, partial [Woeseia sp.]